MRGIINLLHEIESPEESFRLPSYIEPIADAFAAEPPQHSHEVKSKSRKYGFGVHRFLDLEAAEEISYSDSASSSES